MNRLGLPDAFGWWTLGAGAVAWWGVLAGLNGWWPALAVTAVLGAGAGYRRRGFVALVVVMLGAALSGWTGARADDRALSVTLPDRPARLIAAVTLDPVPGNRGWYLLARPRAWHDGSDWVAWAGPVLVVSTTDSPDVDRGDLVEVRGRLRARASRVRGVAVGGTVEARSVVGVGSVSMAAGLANAVRGRVLAPLDAAATPASALLAGFLVGDTSRLPAGDVEALRRSGLSHYVAVSGGNVALFMTMWWILLAPLASHRWIRPVVGVAGLILFSLVTRGEPSVVRASLTAGVLLIGRSVGVPLDVWSGLGLAVTGALLVAGRLAVDLGFQLSVVATIGVLVGARLGSNRKPAWLWKGLAATLAAQAAVTPLLLATFGTVPLVSPLANILAAPLVTAATSLGGVGAVARIAPLIEAGEILAGWVLAIARQGASWPQLDGAGIVAASVTGAALFTRLRPAAFGVIAIGAVFLAVPRPDSGPALIVFDVGQGDSILVQGKEATVLVDGGPDPEVLARKLADRRVKRIDILVLSHPHADHMVGLEAVVGRIPVGVVWDASSPHDTQAHRSVAVSIAEAGIPVVVPVTGATYRLGDVVVEVLGPLRRYAGPNDQSLVLRVHLSGLTVLLSGDIETVAQRELGPIPSDVLKVPHQGAATSDPTWLGASSGRLAVISVGPNGYGHPAEWVEQVLRDAGAEVVRTDQVGDIVIRPPPDD